MKHGDEFFSSLSFFSPFFRRAERAVERFRIFFRVPKPALCVEEFVGFELQTEEYTL